MNLSDRCYVFGVKGNLDLSPLGKTTDSGVAAFVFTEQVKALAFAAGMRHSHDWIIRELVVLDAIEWLANLKENAGATVVWLDPDRQQEGHRELPIDFVIAMLQRSAGN